MLDGGIKKGVNTGEVLKELGNAEVGKRIPDFARYTSIGNAHCALEMMGLLYCFDCDESVFFWYLLYR